MGRDHMGGCVERNGNCPKDDEVPGDIGGWVNKCGVKTRKLHPSSGSAPRQ